MKPREQDGVVDERLNVYGVQNLKVAGKLLSYYFYFLFFAKSLNLLFLFFQTSVSHQVT